MPMCLRNPQEKPISFQQCAGVSQGNWAGEQTLQPSEGHSVPEKGYLS